jgi:hypothetical protein
MIVFLSIVIAFLLIPLNVYFWFTKEGPSARGSVRIGWLGITLVRREMSIKGKKGEEEKRKLELKRIGETFRLLRESSPHLTDLLRAFERSVSVRGLSCEILFGLNDPADTAATSGYLWSLMSVVNASPKCHLAVRPDFLSERLDGSIAVELKVRLLRIVAAFVRALTKKPVRQLFRGART